MDEDGDLFQSFNRLGNEIVAERERRVSEGARDPDIAFDLLAMILRHYHEEYCRRESLDSCLEDLLGTYPWAAHASAVPTEVIREWVLHHCDQAIESVPYKIVAMLPGEYLTFLWRVLKDRDVVSLPRQDTDDEKIRATLVGLGFSEPYRPRWGFSYICRELKTARDALSKMNTASIDSKMVETIRNNTVLVLKSYKRFLQMLLSFYGQHLFRKTELLIAAMEPDVRRPEKYLDNCCLGDLIALVSLLERSAKLIKGKPDENEPLLHSQLATRLKEQAKVNDESWEEFSRVIVMKRDLIDRLQQACEDTLAQLKLGTRAAYTVEEVLAIKEYALGKLIGHPLGLEDEYRAVFPTVIALKACRQDENKLTRIDYLDEMGSWGFVRKDIAFQPGRDFYLFPRPGKSPIVMLVEDKHQDFIIRYDRPIEPQLDDNELRVLFGKFKKLQMFLERSDQKIVVILPASPKSPLENIGIMVDGNIIDSSKLIVAIQTGESQIVEFKATCRDPDRGDKVDRSMLAQEMAALANTKGGLLVLGIPDRDRPQDIEKAQAMRQELKASTDVHEQKGDKWGPKYILDIVAGVAKGSSSDPHACWPSITYAPHLLEAATVGLERGLVLVLAVFPMPEDKLCMVNQHYYVRKGASCMQAENPWVEEWHRAKRKPWL